MSLPILSYWSVGTRCHIGSLAGLVGITGGCAFVGFPAAIIIGLVAGIILLLWGDMLEKVKIDDAVGACISPSRLRCLGYRGPYWSVSGPVVRTF